MILNYKVWRLRCREILTFSFHFSAASWVPKVWIWFKWGDLKLFIWFNILNLFILSSTSRWPWLISKKWSRPIKTTRKCQGCGLDWDLKQKTSVNHFHFHITAKELLFTKSPKTSIWLHFKESQSNISGILTPILSSQLCHKCKGQLLYPSFQKFSSPKILGHLSRKSKWQQQFWDQRSRVPITWSWLPYWIFYPHPTEAVHKKALMAILQYACRYLLNNPWSAIWKKQLCRKSEKYVYISGTPGIHLMGRNPFCSLLHNLMETRWDLELYL